MPISKKILMKCRNCGFKTYRTIGDVLPDKNMMKACPICRKKFTMEIIKTNEESNPFDTIVGTFGSIIDSLNKK